MITSNQQIKSLVNTICVSANKTFGDRCTAIYIMGSLARGGFSEVASDIDMGVILRGPLQNGDSSAMESLRLDAVNACPNVSNNVSLFWGSVPSINGVVDAGRYPPFDRLDLIEHAQLLSGSDIRGQLIKPTKDELEIASAAFSLDYLGNKQRVDEFLDCGRLSHKDTVYITKTVLFPARFIYLAETGEVAGNEASFRYYTEHFPGDDAELVRQAYHWRLKGLPDHRDTVTEALDKGLIRLYQNFIDLYADRMTAYGQDELREDLLEWKRKITPASR